MPGDLLSRPLIEIARDLRERRATALELVEAAPRPTCRLSLMHWRCRAATRISGWRSIGLSAISIATAK
jgi:hypothetical protein